MGNENKKIDLIDDDYTLSISLCLAYPSTQEACHSSGGNYHFSLHFMGYFLRAQILW
jgi:hypothetical protein